MLKNEELLSAKLGNQPIKTILMFTQVNEGNAENEEEVTAEEITTHLRKTRNNSAPGPDGVGYKTLKILRGKKPEILTCLFAACFRFRIFPDNWKEGRVIRRSNVKKINYKHFSDRGDR